MLCGVHVRVCNTENNDTHNRSGATKETNTQTNKQTHKQTNKQTNRQLNGHLLKLVERKTEQKHDKEMVSVPEDFKVRSAARQRGRMKEDN